MPPRSAPAPGRDTRGRFVAGGKPAPAADGGRLGRLRRFLWSGVVLGGLALVGAAASDTVKATLKEGFGAFATGQQACALREWWARNVGAPPKPADPGRFRVLVARLHNDDGRLTGKVFNAFLGEEGFQAVQICRSIGLGGDDNIEVAARATRDADDLREGRRADLIVWGQVADAGAGAVHLWFSAASVRPTMTRAPWKIEQGTLGGEFRKEFALALQAMALAAIPPLSDAQGRAVADLLRPRLPPLRSLLAHPPEGLPQDDRTALRLTLGYALQTFGDQAGDSAALREAIEQYRQLLSERPRERAPLQWALTQNNLGTALWQLGEREAGSARLEEAVAAYRGALGEWTRERAPLDWAITMENLSSVEEAWSEKTGDESHARAALAACDDALEGYRRARADNDVERAARSRDRLAAKLAVVPKAAELHDD